MKTKRRPEKFPLRVIKGGFAPADNGVASRLRERNYHIGDIVFAELRKPRNPKFHRLAHALGTLVAENIDSFDGMAPHKVLKRLQLESNVGCEEVAYSIPGCGMIVQKIPMSLSYESMDEGEFKEAMRGMCRHIASEYWEGVNEQDIAEMAQLMVGE